MRARYRALARDLHPDRHGSDLPDSDGRATRMAEVNRAWATLGDPQRRAAYDQRLGRGSEPAAVERGDYHADRPPPRHEMAPGCLGAGTGSLVWGGLVVLLLAIFVFTAYAGGDRPGDGRANGGSGVETTSADGENGEEAGAGRRVRDLRGMCIQQIRGAVVPVDCFSVPHEGVIVAQASLGTQCPEGTIEWVVRQQEVLACTEEGSEAEGVTRTGP